MQAIVIELDRCHIFISNSCSSSEEDNSSRMKEPPRLSPGFRVAILASASAISEATVEATAIKQPFSHYTSL